MARDTTALLSRIEQFVDDDYRPARPLFAGQAAVFASIEAFSADAATAATWGGSEGIWLDLHARGQGVYRRAGEGDASVRSRMRTPALQITPADLLAAVQSLLTTYGYATTVTVVQWYEGPWVDEVYADEGDVTRISPGPHGFLMLIPSTAWADTVFVEVLADELNSRKASGTQAYVAPITI
ncbi:MAG: hypothetical protein AAFV53_23240 [Myxococcota bacterium]